MLVIAALALGVAERVYLVNGSSYPSWMAGAELGEVAMARIVALWNSECRHCPVEVFRKSNGAVLRCGDFWFMPSTRTYFADTFRE